jgi:hypothetical protein
MPGNGLDETWHARIIADGLPQLLDSAVQTVVEINKGVLRPQESPELFPGYEFSGAIQQDGQDLQRLILNADAHSRLAQLTSAEVNLKIAEAIDAGAR